MGHKFAEIAFTPAVRDIQHKRGSRSGYAAMESGKDHNQALGPREIEFIEARDSFYMASVSETGWPYIQHRGGPPGFMRVLDSGTIGFADFSGNRQYISTGNFSKDDRVSLIFLDYPNRARLKLLGHVSVVSLDDDERIAKLEVSDYRARVERGFVIKVEAFDWNCPQHITPRYSEREVDTMLEPLLEENRRLKEAYTNGVHAETAVGEGPLELLVTGVRQITPHVRGYELQSPSGDLLPSVAAGAHIRVPVQLDDGAVVERHYSIHAHSRSGNRYEIAVQREENGRGGSEAVHSNWQIGSRIKTVPPKNNFSLHADERPVVLIAAGIGITPIKAMASELTKRGSGFQLHYAGRRRASMAFVAELEEEYQECLSVYSDELDERMDIESIVRNAPSDAIIYVCGPAGLIDAVISAGRTIGVPDERIRFERFVTAAVMNAKPFTVKLEKSNLSLEVSGEESLLDTMLEAGIDVPYSCKGGSCRTCAIKVIDGQVEHHDSALSEVEREETKLMCPCVSRARTDYLVVDV